MGIITTEQQEQQQREKDEKLRADIRKSLDVDTDSAGIVESLYKRIPTNARLLLENIAGVDTPITAEDFTKDELVEMVFLAEKQKQYNKKDEEMLRLGLKDEDITKENFDYLSKRAKTYEDTRGKTSVNPYKEVGDEASAEERLVDKGYLDSIVDSFTDPRYGVATTLGKYTALDENGKISRIKDTYNFNKKQRNLPTDFIGAVKRIMISPELAGEYLANALGTEDREVDIKLPRKMKEGGMAKRMAEQMELFEPVERGFNEGGDTSSAKDAAMQDLQSSAADKKAARQDQFDKLTDMLMSGEIKDMPEEKQQKFIKLYKMMKSQGFNEGGLMEEGGMVDEESGNEVPPGSLREEVRDDIPAQLSEGEFVFPADVVRYIGLENLMRMRQEAKQGLAQMEAMGQMGNSEEAVMPDDLPFDMYDLDIEDEEEYNSETRNYQVGGYVPPSVPQQPYNQPTQVNPQTGTYTLPGTGIAGYQVPSGGQTGYTPYGGAQPYFQPVQFTGPQYQTALQTTNLPTFAETVGQRPGQYDELRMYQNDAGQTLQIPFKDGKPIYPIPEGYRPMGDQPAPEEAPTTVTPTLGQAQVRDDGGRDRDGPAPGGSTDVTGIGYNKSGLIDSLSKTISKYGTGFGVLSEAVSGISPINIASQIMGRPADTKVSSNTSAAFGGVLDAFRGMQGTPAELARQAIAVNKGVNQGFRGYTDTRSLSNMEEVDQAVIAGYAEVVMPDIMKSFVNADGSAKSASQTNSELRDALSDLGLSKSDIDAIANAGGNYNQNQKLSRALGNIAVKDIQSTTNKDLIDKVSKAVVAASEKAKAAEEAGNVARDAGLVGVDLSSDAGQKAVDAAKAAADAAFAEEQKAFDDAMKAAGKPDVSDATPAPSSRDEGGSGGRGGSEAGDPSGGAGEGSGTDCLTEKMKVKLNGVVDFVTNIKVGDMIDGCVVKEVLHKHMRSGYFVINNELEITNDHPVLANGAWTKPEELYIGDYINDVKVESIKYIDRMTPTVSIVIDGDSFDVYTEGNTYTVHGRYREVRQQAA